MFHNAAIVALAHIGIGRFQRNVCESLVEERVSTVDVSDERDWGGLEWGGQVCEGVNETLQDGDTGVHEAEEADWACSQLVVWMRTVIFVDRIESSERVMVMGWGGATEAVIIENIALWDATIIVVSMIEIGYTGWFDGGWFRPTLTTSIMPSMFEAALIKIVAIGNIIDLN